MEEQVCEIENDIIEVTNSCTKNIEALFMIQSKMNKLKEYSVSQGKKNVDRVVINIASDESRKNSFIVGSKRSNAPSKLSKEEQQSVQKFQEVLKKTKNFDKSLKSNDNSSEQLEVIGYSNNIENAKHVIEPVVPLKNNEKITKLQKDEQEIKNKNNCDLELNEKERSKSFKAIKNKTNIDISVVPGKKSLSDGFTIPNMNLRSSKKNFLEKPDKVENKDIVPKKLVKSKKTEKDPDSLSRLFDNPKAPSEIPENEEISCDNSYLFRFSKEKECDLKESEVKNEKKETKENEENNEKKETKENKSGKEKEEIDNPQQKSVLQFKKVNINDKSLNSIEIKKSNLLNDSNITIKDKFIIGESSKMKNLQNDYAKKIYLTAYLVPNLEAEEDYDYEDLLNSLPFNITTMDIPYNQATTLFMNQVFFTARTNGDYHKMKGKTFPSKKYHDCSYLVSDKIPSVESIRNMRMGNNLEQGESRYWLDVKHLRFDFNYFDFYLYLKKSRAKNLIEFVSISFSGPKLIQYCHFNFKKIAFIGFIWDAQKFVYTYFYNGEQLVFKSNPNRENSLI